MSIYRGAGGAGDAVADSSSEALLVQQLAIEAQADADAAAASASAAAGSASSASTSATNAAASAASIDVSSFLQKASNLSDLTSASTARTNLGLGTAATTASTAYATAAQGTKADSALQPAAIGVSVQGYDSDLAAFALKTAPSGAVVGTTDTQTLTNKTLTTPTVDKISDASGGVLAPISSVMRNRIINGAMTISQYNGTSSSTPAGEGYFIDRFRTSFSGSTKFTVGQNLNSVTPPTGFINYAGLQVATAGSLGATDYNTITQSIEGFNVSDLAWGTANAKTVTLSFLIYSNITGTFGGSLQNSANNRSYPFTYSIPVANTWTTISVTIAGDTSGTWLTTNGTGIRVFWSLGTGTTYSGTAGAWAGSFLTSATGATSIMASTSNVFYITGVQLEVGTQATSFEYRQYQQELALCQRYYQKYTSLLLSGYAGTTTNYYNTLIFPVELRTTPTINYSNFSNSNSGNASTNLVTPKIWRIQATMTVTGNGFSIFDAETSGAEL